MSYVIPRESIQINATAYRFEGGEHGDVPISFFWVLTPPGRGPGLHVHPYQEVFVMQQGQATFTVGEETFEVRGGQIVVAPAHVPHKFKNSGEEPLQMLTLHPGKQIIQEWLEES